MEVSDQVQTKEFSLIKRCGADDTKETVQIPLTHTLAQVREDHQIGDEWVFMLPNMNISRKMEGAVQV
jgi:hypothetical protein